MTTPSNPLSVFFNNNGQATIYNATASTSTNTGALTVYGGLGVGTNLYTNLATVTNTGQSTSTTTGALTVAGGVGIGGNIYGGGLANITSDVLLGGKVIVNNYQADQIWLNSLGPQYGAIGNYGSGQAWGLGWSGGNKVLVWNTASVVTVLGNIASTSTNTGALVVNGGLGINGQIYAGNSATISLFNTNVTNYGSHLTFANTQTSGQTSIGFTFSGTPKAGIRVDGAGNFVINAGSNNVYFNADIGTSSAPLQFLNNSILYQQVLGTTSTFTGNLIVNTTTNSISTNTGALQVRGGIGANGTIYAGSGITSVSTTSFVSPNFSATIVARMLNSDVLTFSGARGQLFSISDSFTGTIFGVYDISGVPAIEAYDTGNVILAETFGNVGVGVVTSSTTAKLTVGGGVSISGITTVTNTTQATSTNSGALIVNGGAGIWGNLYVGGTLNAASVVGNISTATYANNINITNDTTSVGLQYLTFVSASSGYNSLKTAATSGISYYPNSGNLGIGTNNPGNRLTVYTTATNTDGLLLGSSVGGGNVSLRPNNSQGANNGITQAGDAGIIYSSAAGQNSGGFVITPWYSGTSGMRFDSSGTVTIPLAQDATTTATGGLRVTGGVGIGGTLYANNATISNQTNSTSSTTGALIVSGGLGVRKDLWVGGGAFASTLTVNQVYTQGNGAAQINGGLAVNGTAIGKAINLQGGNNLLSYSTDLTNGNWNKVGSSLTNTGIVGPDGITISALLTATNAFALVAQGVIITAGLPYTFSAFVKYRDQQYFTIALSSLSQATGFVVYDLLGGSVSSTGQGTYNASIVPVTNGWYRVSTTYLSSATININYNLWVGAYTGANYTPTGVYLWKPQIEVGNSVSAPTDSVGTAVTSSNNLYLPSGIITANSLEGTPIGQTTSSSASFTTATVRSTSQNLLPYSTPTTGFWNTYTAAGTASAVIVFNTATDPNYAGSAAQISISSVAVNQVAGVFLPINFGAALLAAATYTGSLYIRGQNGGEVVWLMLEDNNTFIATSATLTTSWTRYSITAYRPATSNFLGIGGWGQYGYTLANSSTFYVWGGQVVQGDRPGPYTPTNGAIVFNPATLSFNGAATVNLTNSATLAVSTSVSIASVTSATSTLTGALTVGGGIGAGGDLWIGGNEYIQKTNITANADTISAMTYSAAYASTVSNTDIFFKPDGTKMFGVSASGVYSWSLGTAWSITGTITTSTSLSLAAVETAASGLTFSPDGTKMVVIGNTAVANATFGILAAEDRAYYFTLATPWDVSSATLAGSIRFATGQQGYTGTGETSPTACTYDSTGSYFYMIGTNVRRVFQYSLSTPYVVTTASSTFTNGIVLTEDTQPQGLSFNYAGTRMYVSGQIYDFVYEYRLSTPWDVTTAVFYDKYFVGIQNATMTGLYVNDTATNNIFLTGSTGIYQYQKGTQSTFINPETTASGIILSGNVRVKGASSPLVVDSNAYFFGPSGVTVYTNIIAAGQSGVNASIFTGISTGALSFYTAQSSGALTVGGAAATGAINIGISTGTQILNLAGGASGLTTTVKTVNLGTGGLAGSTSNINIGSTVTGAFGLLTIGGTQTNITSTITSVSTTTGALTVQGGVGIAADTYIGGQINVLGSTSTVLGQLGVGPNATFATVNNWYGLAPQFLINNNQAGATILGIGNNVIGAASTQIRMIGGTANSYTTEQLNDNSGSPYLNYDTGPGVNFRYWSFGGVDKMRLTSSTFRLTVATTVTDTTQTTSTGTGALAVSGGVAVGGNLAIGGYTYYNSLKSAHIYIKGTGLNNNGNNAFYINGAAVNFNTNQRGLTFFTIDKATLTATNYGTYDTYGTVTSSTQLAALLNGMTNTQFGVLLSFDAVEAQINSTLITALANKGLYKLAYGDHTGSRHPYAALFDAAGVSGVPSRNVIEIWESNNITAPQAVISTYITTDGTAQGAGFQGNNLTNALISGSPDTVIPAVYVDQNYGITINGATTVTNTTVASSTNTGAFVVQGGVGIWGNLWVGGTINATISGSITTATNLAGGTTGQIPYQANPGQTQFFGPGTAGQLLVSNGAAAPLYQSTLTIAGNVVNVSGGVASNSTSTGALIVAGGIGVNGNININGGLNAITKSFVINHPTKPGMRLRYGSLEGPENGVYIRGRLTGSTTIQLPDYWTKLVDPESITVQITPIGKHQKLFVESIKDNVVTIDNDAYFGGSIDCYYVIFAERADTDKLEVEMPG